MCVEIYQFLKILLREKGLSTAVGDEGGFAPDLKDSRDVLRLILEAVEKAGMNREKIFLLRSMQQPVNFMMKNRVCTVFRVRVR